MKTWTDVIGQEKEKPYFKHILQQYIDTNNALLYRAFEADGI